VPFLAPMQQPSCQARHRVVPAGPAEICLRVEDGHAGGATGQY
jgi:hypothetical protein